MIQYLSLSVIIALIFCVDSYSTKDDQFKKWHLLIWFLLHLVMWPVWVLAWFITSAIKFLFKQ